MNWQFFSVMMTIAAAITGPFVIVVLVKALSRRLEGGAGGDAALRADLEELRVRVGESDRLEARVAELEERLDFTERLLARQREPERIVGGPDAV